MAVKPAYNERIQWSENCHDRGNTKLRLDAIHTQEGNGTAASLANYLCNPSAQVSYHYTVDNARNVVKVVDTDMASWSVGNANNFCLNICFAGSFAGWSRQQWLDNMGNAIEIAAWIAVQDCKKYGLDPRTISWDEISAGKTGITDHRGVNMGALHTAGHTDCGDGYPWDIFQGYIEDFAGGVEEVLPNVTGIEVCRAANEWLGDKVTPNREEKAPDGKGRYAHYQNGSIYWHPNTGAHAVPMEIRPKWESLKWETGFLGYPTGDRVDVVDFTKSDGTVVHGGVIQAFQGGTIYHQNDDKDAYVVKGAIRDNFKSLRYEMGPLGWPQSDETPWVGGQFQQYEHGTITWIADGNKTLAIGADLLPIPLVSDTATTEPSAPAKIDKPDLTGLQLIDYSAAVPSAKAVRDAGYSGAVRYVSDPRETWMKGKPLTKAEVDDYHANGLVVASNYQYSKGGNTTSDWTVPSDGPGDARRGLELHKAAGGPDTAPIYVSVDASPTRDMYDRLIKPYLQGWISVIGADRLGVYANGRVIDWLIADGIGKYYWQHNWSENWKNAAGEVNGHHPAAHVHQIRIDQDSVGGVGVDVNVVLKRDFGQW